MLYRKIERVIERHLTSTSDKIMVVEGARQVGKSFIIREVAKRLFPNYIELNFVEDKEGQRIYEDIKSIDDFFLILSAEYGSKLGDWNDTIIFLDEIQLYPQYITWLKFFKESRKYRFIASGSLLGLSLRRSVSVPVGSIEIQSMYPLDFEEFLIACDFGNDAIAYVKQQFDGGSAVIEPMHDKLMNLFKRYLLVGGMPDAVNAYIKTHNINNVRNVQSDIHRLYIADAAQYEIDVNKRLLIERIYNMIPSQMEKTKKRIVAKDIEEREGSRFSRYAEEFEYLLSSGIALGANAITNPKFPLVESAVKNLIKLYLNDVGLLTNVLYRNNVKPLLEEEVSVNLGGVYENVVAQELKSHGNSLYYYDNRKVGEVDFVINDFHTLSPLPVEVKSGKDFTRHSALSRFMSVADYGVKQAVVLNNTREVVATSDGVVYMPIYYVMFLNSTYSQFSPESFLI